MISWPKETMKTMRPYGNPQRKEEEEAGWGRVEEVGGGGGGEV